LQDFDPSGVRKGQGTKSLRSSRLRGSKSGEAGSRLIEDMAARKRNPHTHCSGKAGMFPPVSVVNARSRKFLCAGAVGAAGTRSSLRPRTFEGRDSRNNSGETRREKASSWTRHCEKQRDDFISRSALARKRRQSMTGDRDSHFPVHTGLRFSPKAFKPSFASSVIASSAIWLSV